jgi:hypothetical protein
MKKLIFLIAILFVANGIQAQNVTVRMGSPAKTYVEYNTDVAVGNGADVWYKVISDAENIHTEDLIIHLDSIKGGTHTTTVQLLGSKFSTEGYSAIGATKTWKATTGDTTIVMSNATATRWRFYKVLVHVASGDSAKVDYLKFKIWKD